MCKCYGPWASCRPVILIFNTLIYIFFSGQAQFYLLSPAAVNKLREAEKIGTQFQHQPNCQLKHGLSNLICHLVLNIQNKKLSKKLKARSFEYNNVYSLLLDCRLCKSITLSFLYMHIVYKNIQAEICQILRIFLV